MRKLHTRTMPPQGARRPDEAGYHALTRIARDRARSARRPRTQSRPAACCIGSTAPNTPTRSATCSRSTSTSRRCCRPTIRPTASTTSPTCWACRRRCRSAICRRRERSARWRSAIRDVAPGSDTYVIRQDLSQDQHIEGLPLGTVGGTLVRHTFPLDGEYVFQVKLYRTNLNIVRGLEYPHQVEFTVDGERIHLAAFGGKADLAALFEKPTDTGDAVEARLRVRAPIKAGPHVGRGHVHPGTGDRGHGPPAGVSAQLRGQLRLVGAAAHADAGDHRAVQRHRPRRHAEPPPDLRVPSHRGDGRGTKCLRAGRSSRRWLAARIASR